MFKCTLRATFLYKSGNKHTVNGLTKLNAKNGEWSWEMLGRNRIFHLGIDNLEAVFITHNTYLVDLYFNAEAWFYGVAAKVSRIFKRA